MTKWWVKCRAGRWSGVFMALLFLLSGCASQVEVTWRTESEINTAGFNLYRGLSPTGPFDVKVNDRLIPASPDPVTGGEYRFVDRSVRPGVTYYYQLQEVEIDGRVNSYGPIAVHVQGLDWRYVAVLGGLALAVLALWVRGGLWAAVRRHKPPLSFSSPAAKGKQGRGGVRGSQG
jgi:hypothetical protein